MLASFYDRCLIGIISTQKASNMSEYVPPPPLPSTSSATNLSRASSHVCRDVIRFLRSACSLTTEYADTLALYLKGRDPSDPELLTLRTLQNRLSLILPPLPLPSAPHETGDEMARPPIDRVLGDADLLQLIFARFVDGKSAGLTSRKSLGVLGLVCRSWQAVAWRDALWEEICRETLPLLEVEEGGG